MRVEVGGEIHVESFCAETPDCEPQRRQQAIFFIVTLIVTYEFVYGYYNSLFKQVVRIQMCRGARGVHSGNYCWAVAIEEFRAVMIGEP